MEDREDVDTEETDKLIKKVKLSNISSKLAVDFCTEVFTFKSDICTENMYWTSPEAHKLINVPLDENVIESLERRVTLLHNVNIYHSGYKTL